MQTWKVNHRELTNEFSEVAGCKVNPQRSLHFWTLTMNTEEQITKTIPFSVAAKKKKKRNTQGLINFTKEVKDCNETYKTCWKELKTLKGAQPKSRAGRRCRDMEHCGGQCERYLSDSTFQRNWKPHPGWWWWRHNIMNVLYANELYTSKWFSW